ncbi:TetR/AcrR family transcriptional regulator [Micromonospora sp. DT233]|uniref:TetR/AcrR family transcriptional regulator n=1 Tax=Micromonospora sp. DT233 TaxID=3393432 RepID=UPI003CF003C4
MNLDDPRARRTRAALHAALRELAAERELSDVTMSAVAARAGVNRATLYQHYRDLDALLTDAMEDTVAVVARAAALCPLDAPPDVAPAPLVDLFAHVADRAVLYRRVLGPQGSARCAARLRDRLAAELAARFATGARPPRVAEVPVDVHAAWLAGALLGLLDHWLAADRPAPPAGIALATWRLLRT